MQLRDLLAELWLAHPNARPAGLERRGRRLLLWGAPMPAEEALEQLALGALMAYVVACKPRSILEIRMHWDPDEPDVPLVLCSLSSSGQWWQGQTLLEALARLVIDAVDADPEPPASGSEPSHTSDDR